MRNERNGSSFHEGSSESCITNSCKARENHIKIKRNNTTHSKSSSSSTTVCFIPPLADHVSFEWCLLDVSSVEATGSVHGKSVTRSSALLTWLSGLLDVWSTSSVGFSSWSASSVDARLSDSSMSCDNRRVWLASISDTVCDRLASGFQERGPSWYTVQAKQCTAWDTETAVLLICFKLKWY